MAVAANYFIGTMIVWQNSLVFNCEKTRVGMLGLVIVIRCSIIRSLLLGNNYNIKLLRAILQPYKTHFYILCIDSNGSRKQQDSLEKHAVTTITDAKNISVFFLFSMQHSNSLNLKIVSIIFLRLTELCHLILLLLRSDINQRADYPYYYYLFHM